MWFDRGLDFGHGSLVYAQLGNLPRVIASGSLDRQITDSRLVSKHEVKIASVEWAISALLFVYENRSKYQLDQFFLDFFGTNVTCSKNSIFKVFQ